MFLDIFPSLQSGFTDDIKMTIITTALTRLAAIFTHLASSYVYVPGLRNPQMLTSVQADGVLHCAVRQVFRQPIRFEGAFR